MSIKCTFTRFVFERYYTKHFYGPCNSHEIKELHEKNTSKNLNLVGAETYVYISI